MILAIITYKGQRPSQLTAPDMRTAMAEVSDMVRAQRKMAGDYLPAVSADYYERDAWVKAVRAGEPFPVPMARDTFTPA